MVGIVQAPLGEERERAQSNRRGNTDSFKNWEGQNKNSCYRPAETTYPKTCRLRVDDTDDLELHYARIYTKQMSINMHIIVLRADEIAR